MVGGAGLIGSHTIDRLLKEDVREIVIFDNFTRGRMENVSQALEDPRVTLFAAGGDVLQTDVLDAAFAAADGVFHFAALWLLQCHDFPRSAFEVNVRGTFNILDACARLGVKRLVFSSSASVYGDAVEEPMTEDHPFLNRNFYGATKIAGEAMARAMAQRYGFGYVGLRYMNVYGPRQDYRGAYTPVIMRMLDAIDTGVGPTINGDGTEAFDFVDVEDCAEANVLAMKSDRTDRFYNIGTGVRTSLRELAELLLEITRTTLPVRYLPRSMAALVRNRVGSTARAREELGFEARIEFLEGLTRLVRWRAADLDTSAKNTSPMSLTASLPGRNQE